MTASGLRVLIGPSVEPMFSSHNPESPVTVSVISILVSQLILFPEQAVGIR